MSRQSGRRAIFAMLLLLAVNATCLQAESTEKAVFSFASGDEPDRTIAGPGYTAVYRIHNDGPARLKITLEKQNRSERSEGKWILSEGEAIDIAKSDDEKIVLDPASKTTGSFQLIWAK